MKKYFLTLFFFWTFALLAYPCRCREVSVADGVKAYDLVLKGRVLSVVKTLNYAEVGLEVDTTGLPAYVKKFNLYATLTVVKVKVDKIYKGVCESDTLAILTPATEMTCGYKGFEEEQAFIIYGMKEYEPFLMGADSYSSVMPIPKIISSVDPCFWTNNCSRTQLWNEEEELQVLSVVQAIKRSSDLSAPDRDDLGQGNNSDK